MAEALRQGAVASTRTTPAKVGGCVARSLMAALCLFLVGCGGVLDSAKERLDASIDRGIAKAKAEAVSLVETYKDAAQDTAKYVAYVAVSAAAAILALWAQARKKVKLYEQTGKTVVRAVEDAASGDVKALVAEGLASHPKRAEIEKAIRTMKG